ncbi:MAG: FecR domain-containing protein [Bdellovibrionales bacterium]|nr:FecR domain-containing protein [Bdellovibrionales bacterium]
MKTTLSLLTILFSLNLWANVHTGTFVQVNGEVLVLTQAKEKPFVLYQNKKYSYKPAKIGSRVGAGEVIQTKGNSKAKIIFANGDSLNIGAGSSIVMPKPTAKKKQKETELKIIYGKIRSVISKKSPRNNLKIKTKTAVAGVRGTDVYVHHNLQKGTLVTVMRGKVEVSSAENKKIKPITVETGYMTTDVLEDVQKIDKKPITKEKVIEVQVQSTVKPDVEVSETVKKEIQVLEKQNKEVVLEDIKNYQPEIYQEIKDTKDKMTVEEVSAKVVSKVYKAAPSESPKFKPSQEDLKGIGNDVYEKYFEQ